MVIALRRSKDWSPENASLLRERAATLDADLITIDELKRLLNVSTRTIRSWDRKGLLPARTRHGRHLKYSRVAINEWLAGPGRGKTG
jgi:excisionase family DNA binding protein